MSSNTVIPAYPYEGAFYWFLSAGNACSIEHPYYRVLYGPSPGSQSTRAAAIASLYPKILLGAADAYLPDSQTYLSDGKYDHPDLGISLDYGDNEWAPDIQDIAHRAAVEPAARTLFAEAVQFSEDSELQHHFLCRTALQIRLSARTGGTLIGDDFFRRAYAVVAPWVPELAMDAAPAPVAPSRLLINESVTRLVGLDFAPRDLDAFAAIRASDEIARYAASFRNALSGARDPDDLENSLAELMIQAMDTEEISKRASSAFETTGSLMNVVGFIPLIGTVATAIGTGADAAGRIASAKAESASWYLLGAKMGEVALRDALSRRRAGAGNT